MAFQPIGTVTELWRYPVKSMRGERCETLLCEPRGINGDRVFAVRDVAGKLGSGKNTRRFRKIDGLFGFQATYQGQVPYIRFPSGELLSGAAPTVDAALSEALGQAVTLAKEAAVSHLDAEPVHLLTSASLAWLQAALPSATVDARRFRPNLVIELPGAQLVEQDWIGRRLRIGDEVELVVTAGAKRCGMVVFPQAELPEEPGILRHIAQAAELYFGVYARVVVPGIIRRNDVATLINPEQS